MLERLDLANVSARAIAPTSGIGADTKRKRARCRCAALSDAEREKQAAARALAERRLEMIDDCEENYG